MGSSMSSREAALERRLEETQQALREERHKYRALLAAPSAANGRAGGRTVVGLPSIKARMSLEEDDAAAAFLAFSGRGNGSGSQLDMGRSKQWCGSTRAWLGRRSFCYADSAASLATGFVAGQPHTTSKEGGSEGGMTTS